MSDDIMDAASLVGITPSWIIIDDPLARENPHKFNTPAWFAMELMLGKDVEYLKKLSGWKKFNRSK